MSVQNQLGTCQTCKHWGNYDKGANGNTPFESNVCDKFGTIGGKPQNITAKALAFDYEGYGTEFQTAPDFGCNQWAAKQEQTDDGTTTD